MHDPKTLAFSIKLPFGGSTTFFSHGSKMRHRPSLIDIWHVDPCKGPGGDDSCGWFMRAHHGDPKVLEKIEKHFEYDWDRTFTSDSSGKTYACGLFLPNGRPSFSVHGVVLNLFFWAAIEVFKSNGTTNWKKANKWMRKNLLDILLFAENPTDSLYDSITSKFGDDGYAKAGESTRARMRKERIHNLAAIIYGWILRSERPWWKHPRWHIHHWNLQIHFLEATKRWAFTRCCKCGKRFKFGSSVCTGQWHGTGPRWFKSEEGVYHDNCYDPSSDAESSKVSEESGTQ